MDNEKRVYPKEFLEYVQSITNKRAKVVIDHILAHGFITTEDLEKTYGYNHPPRAARDVREAVSADCVLATKCAFRSTL